MSIRKTWIGVLLEQHGLAVGERLLYNRALARMSESEANEVVLLLEASLEGTGDPSALEKAKRLLEAKCIVRG